MQIKPIREMKPEDRCRHCEKSYLFQEALPWHGRGYCSTECFFGARGEAHVTFIGPAGDLIRQSVIRYQAQTGRNNVQYMSMLGLLFPADDLSSNYDFLVVLLKTASTPLETIRAMEVLVTCLTNWNPSSMDAESLQRVRQIRAPHARAIALKALALEALSAEVDPKTAAYRLTLAHTIRATPLPESMNAMVPMDVIGKRAD